MSARIWLHHLRTDRVVPGPPVLILLPTLTVAAYWLGGEMWLTLVALLVPAVTLLANIFTSPFASDKTSRDSATGLLLRDSFETAVERVFAQTRAGVQKSACYYIELDDADDLIERHGQAAVDIVALRVADRLSGALRPDDHIARLSDLQFAVCVAPVSHFDLEIGIQVAGRVQTIVEEPIYVDGITIYVSCSIGFCLSSRAEGKSSNGWINAARLALTDARQQAPSAIRTYTHDLQTRHDGNASLAVEVRRALNKGEFQAWFQPQLNTETGRVAGFEALARWLHPTRGSLPPNQFLPVIEAQGQLPQLTATMLRQALQALINWDLADLRVPQVSVNLSQQDLADPNLADMIAWELERFDVTPDRLCLEILETVVTSAPDDVILRNLKRLTRLGCTIDLDDYGTGHASIAAIKRFPIKRLKIDRSFVMKSDQDPNQQRLVNAILSMAEHLDLETLAEGVETIGEHAILAQLGCGYVQGFGIARPMPFEDSGDWLRKHEAKIARPPQIQRRTG